MKKFKKIVKSFFKTLGLIVLLSGLIFLMALFSGPPTNKPDKTKKSGDTTTTKTIIIDESLIQIDSIQIIVYGKNEKN